MNAKYFLLILSIFPSLLFGNQWTDKLQSLPPQWMKECIDQDFQPYSTAAISKSRLDKFFEKYSAELHLVRFTLQNNLIFIHKKFQNQNAEVRIASIRFALEKITETVPLPNISFIISMHDGIKTKEKLPIFVMAKLVESTNLLLIPDFDALTARYQVLKGSDITKNINPWKRKKSVLIWRGSTAQCTLNADSQPMTDHNLHLFSRVRLCQLSLEYPHLINAKFTFLVQGGEKIPFLQKLQGNYVSYESLCSCKYQILIDGNSASYSCSGWRFFSNSVVFKPESQWVQWYFPELKPMIHYVPVKDNLDDLVDKVIWAQNHDREAQEIASQARQFAMTHLTIQDNWLYLYLLLQKYSHLNFVN
jgi:hypothetical protein